MNPFRLNCPNCQSRILVRHAYLIGQTLPCPKCKDLLTVVLPTPEANAAGTSNSAPPQVLPPPIEPETSVQKQVQPPQPSSGTPHHRLDSAALTKDDYGDWEAVLANIPQNLTEDQLENIAWDQVASDQEPSLHPAAGSDKSSHIAPRANAASDATSKSALSSDGAPDIAHPDDLSSLGIPTDELDTPYRGQNTYVLPGGQSSTAQSPPDTAPGSNKSLRKPLVLVTSIGLASTLMAGVGFWAFLKFASDPTRVADLPIQRDGQALSSDANSSATNADGLDGESATSNSADVIVDETIDQDAGIANQEVPVDDGTEDEGAEGNLAEDEGTELASNDPDSLEVIGTEDGSGISDELTNLDDTADASLLDEMFKLPGEDLRNSSRANSATPAPTLADPSNEEQITANNKPGDAPNTLPSALTALEGDSAGDNGEISEQLPDIFGPNGFGQLLTPHMNIEDTTFSGRAPLDELDLERLEESKVIYSHPDPQQVPLWDDKTSSLLIGRIRFTGQSLASCIELFSRMSDVGITIDWPSLRAAGLSETLPISNDLQNQTLDQIIRTILEENDLRLDIPGDGLPLVRPKSALAEDESPKRWDLSNLSSDNTAVTNSAGTATPDPNSLAVAVSVPQGTSATLAELIVDMWGMSSYCSADGNELRWEPTAPLLSKASVWSTLQLLAQLKDSPPFAWPEPGVAPVQLFDPEDWHQSQGILVRQVPATVHLPELRPVSEILAIAAKETGTELIIDWQAAWQHGLVPNQSEISVVRNRTLPQISKRFRDQYSLELVSIGKNKVLLTTPEARKTRFIVLPLRLKEGVSLDELKRSLYLLAPLSSEGKSLFKVAAVPGTQGLFLARVVLPTVEQLDDDELHLAFGWEKMNPDE